MLTLFLALARLPLAEVTALTFTAPLFGTIGAAVLLGERVHVRRWTATCVGMIGALIILRPGAATVQPASLLALASAVFMAAAMLSIKSLSRTEHPNAIVIHGKWVSPSLPQIWLILWTDGGRKASGGGR